jgi:sporulation protein YlmC with PRC-barrel domain
MKRLPIGLTLFLILSLAISAASAQANSVFLQTDETPTPEAAPQNLEGLQQQAEALDDIFASDLDASGQLARFSNIPGYAVYDLDGEEVGRVHSVLLDQNAQVAYLVLRADYEFQAEGQFIPVPWGAIDVMSRQQVLDQFGNDMPAAPEVTTGTAEETPIVPTPELPMPTPVEEGVNTPTPIQPGDATPTPDNNNNDAATPVTPADDDEDTATQPGQIGVIGQQDDQRMSQPSYWDRQFALVLNVDRQVLQDAPAFDQVLVEDWEQAEWQNNLRDYWGQHVTLIPETGEPGEDVLVQVLDVRGKRVEDQNGQLIGRVFEVIMRQPSNQIAYVIVESDGRMGFDVERTAIPQQHLVMEIREGRNVLVLTAERQMIDEAPRLQTEADLRNLHTPGADLQIQEYWGTVEDIDPSDQDPTPAAPPTDPTPVSPVTTPENDENQEPTPVTPLATPENDQTPTAPIATAEPPPPAPITPVQETPVTPPIPETGVQPDWMGFFRFSNIPGMAVYDQDGDEVGRINSVLVDQNGRLAYLVLRADNELMADGQFVAVPWGAVDVMNRQQVLQQFDQDLQDTDQNNDQDTPAATPATPAQPRQAGEPVTPATPATPAQPGQEDDENGLAQDPLPTMTRTQWDRQFALVLNVDRQTLLDAPAFDTVLVDNWDVMQWRTDLNDYWVEHTTLIPQTGLEAEDQELFQYLNISGVPVEDQNGDRIGRVLEAVMQQPGDRLGYLVVETGGVFGIDTDRTAVPVQHLDMQQRNGHVVLVLTADRQLFDQAPRLQTEADLMNLQYPGGDLDLRQHWQTDIDTDDTTPVTPAGGDGP